MVNWPLFAKVDDWTSQIGRCGRLTLENMHFWPASNNSNISVAPPPDIVSIHPSPLLDLLTSPPHYQSLSAEVMYLPTLALVARGRQLDQRTPPTLQPNHCCDHSAKPSFLPTHTSAKQSFILWTGTFVNKWLTQGLDAKIWLVMCKSSTRVWVLFDNYLTIIRVPGWPKSSECATLAQIV